MVEPVRARRAAIVASVLVAIYVVVTFVVRPVPDAIVALLGGPDGGIARHGGLRVHYRPAPGSEAALAAYVASRADVERDGDVLVLEFPGIAEAVVPEVTDVLVGGGLAMKEAVETDYARRIAELVDLPISPGDDPPEAFVEIDAWTPDVGGVQHVNAYVVAYSAEAMERVLAAAEARGFALPEGHELGYQWLEPASDARDRRPLLRTYELVSTPLIDGTMIANALGSYDPNTNRPIVLLDFTREGGQRLCEVSARIKGRKLAILLGGAVHSAPIINDAICGGRASITMGGSDPSTQERERDALVAVLAQGALPPGGIIEQQRWTPPPDLANQEWAGRLLLGFVSGGAVALLVLFGLRATRTQRARALPATGAYPWRRLAVTLLAPLAAIGGTYVGLPLVNDVELAHIAPGGLGPGASVFALGVTPILSAFALVELVALAIPRLRWRRHDPRGRVRLGQAVAVLAIAFALVQGYFYAAYFESLSRGVVELVVDPGWQFRLITMASLAAGTMLLALVAGVIREHGLGNGYVAVIVASGLVALVRPYLLDDGVPLRELVGEPEVLAVASIALTAVVTATVLRWRITDGARSPALRLPVTGLAPLTETGGIVLLLTLATGLGVTELLSRAGLDAVVNDAMFWIYEAQTRTWLNLGVLVAMVAVWAWLFARPALIARVAMQAGLERPSGAAWARAALASGGAIVLVGAVWLATRATDATAAGLAAPVLVMLATAAVLDIRADARAHREALVPVGVLHQIQYAGVVERVLADADIPCHLHASHARALLAFFGPFVPVIVLVPAAHGDTARARLDDVLRAPRATVPAARVQPSERDVA